LEQFERNVKFLDAGNEEEKLADYVTQCEGYRFSSKVLTNTFLYLIKEEMKEGQEVYSIYNLIDWKRLQSWERKLARQSSMWKPS
jgi:hypothetical protein